MAAAEIRHWPYPPVIAHRGGGSLAPENTLAALRTGHARGFRAVEFDVMLSADAQPLLIHDATLERTTNGRGPVDAHTLDQLTTLDAGSWFAPAFRGEALPGFPAAAALCRSLGLLANVEIKPAPGAAVRTGEVVAACAAACWQDAPVPPLLSSFEPAALEAARRSAPALPRALVVDAVPGDWEARLQALGCCALHCGNVRLDEATVRAIRDAGYPLAVWTVNEAQRARQLFAWGVNAIFTDRLDCIGPLGNALDEVGAADA